MARLSFPSVALALMVAAGTAAEAAAQAAVRTPAVVARANPLRASSDAIETLVRRVMPSVVQVVVTAYRPHESDSGGDAPLRKQRSMGSGVVVAGDGYILTNAHVVSGAERVQVVLADGATAADALTLGRGTAGLLDARVLGVSDELDLALLQVDRRDLPPLPLADYDALRQGELVFAFGSPDALRNSVSMGVVSAVAQQADAGSATVWIQTDAAVNPGNSGGPLVNADGEVVGLNTFIRSMSGGSEGLGFALPSSVIALAYPQLRDHGHVHRARMGVVAEAITPALRQGLGLATDAGVLVSDVAPGGPAAVAGLRIGDVITSLAGQAVNGMSLGRFNLLLLTLADGQTVPVSALRGTTPLALAVTATVPPHECERAVPVDSRDHLIERLGIMGTTLDEAAAAVLPGLRATAGVVVLARVESGGERGVALARGDVIHAVNGHPVATPQALREALAAIVPGDALVLQVERSGALSYVVAAVD